LAILKTVEKKGVSYYIVQLTKETTDVQLGLVKLAGTRASLQKRRMDSKNNLISLVFHAEKHWRWIRGIRFNLNEKAFFFSLFRTRTIT